MLSAMVIRGNKPLLLTCFVSDGVPDQILIRGYYSVHENYRWGISDIPPVVHV